MHFYEFITKLFSSPITFIFFLIGYIALSFIQNGFLLLGKYHYRSLFGGKKSKVFFFKKIFHHIFSKDPWKDLNFCVNMTKQILFAGYAFSLLAVVFTQFNLSGDKIALKLAGVIIGLFALLLIDLLTYLCTFKWTLQFLSFIGSFYLTLFFPITAFLVQSASLFKRRKIQKSVPLSKSFLKEQLREIFTHDLHLPLDAQDLKRMTAFVTFRERVAKEVMVPRIDVTSLSSDTPLQKAALLFQEENYSRIPVFKEHLDHILGVLHYKDVLSTYINSIEKKELLHTPLETLIKPVIFIPENKKITQLLQEFKAKQVHMAIVVDEYGGTEGIITLEDVLEELVGEIEDEYDMEEDQQFWKLPNGEWIVDAKMSIIDIESKLSIHVPVHPEYETIGGYIYHKAGTIPQKGWSIQLDEFTLEVLSSSERSIEKIRITPTEKNIGR
jgi:putative hemolysin